ncbi:diaminopimelate epimerase [Virgibacillus sp. W0430]|uniref:diaminopimelate epimerase n=1 Tax=Virgibacillus sp. W0430 TaxID=3391580 RepID=UPI003F474277
MKKIPFTKMNGCGNDFLIIDNRNGLMDHILPSGFIQTVCHRRFHVGADGLMLLESSNRADFKMRYFNADGSEGEMCGNGARCIVKYAYEKGLISETTLFETGDGMYEGQIINEQVQINFPSIQTEKIQLQKQFSSTEAIPFYHYLTVGVPHTVCIANEQMQIDSADFKQWAKNSRKQVIEATNGTNMNLIKINNKHEITVRTFERGVEDETFACGSGATASVIIAHQLNKVTTPVTVHTKGGPLTIAFDTNKKSITNITLTGDAVIVAEGFLIHYE